jgi:hypothetical protein
MNGNKNLIVLCSMAVFYTLITFAAICMWRAEMVVIAIFAQPMGNLIGALIMMLKTDKEQPPPGTTSRSASSQEQTTKTPVETPDASG